MLNDVYNKKILELAANIPRIGTLEEADASATAVSRLCGSKVTVHLKLEDGRVSEFAHEVKACALGQASSSIMARNIIGATPSELRQLQGEMRAMLKEGAPAPSGRWSDLEVLGPVREFKSRHASTLLTFDAVVDALDQIEAKQTEAA
ncbi:MAG: iron-sulfur cluster assembly scaffold protein [Rhizobiales bacterium]|nr:iron-sulfur cluster assembly scaffold protein [Hyphomicrobiales bacterium]